MSLLLLAIAGLLTGIAQVLNKKLASKKYNSKSLTTSAMLLNAILAIPLLFYQFYLSRSIYYWLLIIVSTIAFAISTYFSFRAYKNTDVSVVSIVYRLNIVFVALAGILFLKENYTLPSYIGLLFIFLSSAIISFEKDIKLSKGVIFALLMAVFGAIATVLDKIILNDFSAFTYVFVNNLLVGLVFAFNKKTVIGVKRIIKKSPILLLSASLLTTLSFLIVLIVLQKTDVSQTMPVYKSLSFITPVILGIALLGEKKKLAQKILGTICGLAGIGMLYL